MSNPSDIYHTIDRLTLSEFKEKGSKFIGYLFPTATIQTFEETLNQIRKEHIKASHHCYAYRMDFENEIYRYSDDGEPSGTAGKPMYGQIIKNDLYDLACISVRYYGGTNLGTGGLTAAYKNSCALAIENANIIEKTISHVVELKFDYSIMGNLMSELKQLDIPIIEKTLKEEGSLKIELPKSMTKDKIDLLKSKMLGISLEQINDKVKVSGLKINYLD